MRHQLIAISVIALDTTIDGGLLLSATSGLPSVGNTWGPVLIHTATIHKTPKRLWYYKNDLIKDLVNLSEIFQSKEDMYSHLQSKMTSDSVLLKVLWMGSA